MIDRRLSRNRGCGVGRKKNDSRWLTKAQGGRRNDASRAPSHLLLTKALHQLTVRMVQECNGYYVVHLELHLPVRKRLDAAAPMAAVLMI